MLGVVAIVVMLKAPKGLWGLVADRFGWQVFPLERRLEHDPEKWEPVFGKDHAQTRNQ